jgi:cytochrome d ubiquinol oxidase subunit I
MSASVITSSFVVAAVGACWTLLGIHRDHARVFLKMGVLAGLASCLIQLFPTGDQHGKLVAQYQKPGLAAMEGKFESGQRAEVVIIGQPDVARRRLENPIVVPGMLSYLAYGSFGATVTGLNDVPRDEWPDSVELLYYTYHIMVGLGTIFIALMTLATILLLTGRLEGSRPMLWVLMLAFPFPYIATTAGWLTAELGRQPWLVYGLQRTIQGTSPYVPGGNVAFTSLGFMGMYMVLGLLFLYLMMRVVAGGPLPVEGRRPGTPGIHRPEAETGQA